ncbi:MAG: hypothetical protein K2J30_05060, partial [Clostridia bacterium]|nr:hypothetical protein [Clostridia bacterium]
MISTATSQAKLTVNGGIFTENYSSDGFGVVINARGIVVMNGGKITGNGVNTDGTPGMIGIGTSATGHVGSFTMNGGEISNNVQLGGTVTIGQIGKDPSDGMKIKELEFGTFVMNGGTIKNNKTADSTTLAANATNVVRNYGRGGGVNVVTSTSSFTMNGGSIEGNTTPHSGGGVNCIGTFTMNGGIITKNKAGYYIDGTDTLYSAYGGGVVANGTFIMNGGSIHKNTSRVYAGGVYCSGSGAGLAAKCEFNKGSITENEALGVGSSGGGIYLDACNSIVFKNVVVTGNKLPNSNAIGGGIFHTKNSPVTIEGGLICLDNHNQTKLTNYALHYSSGWDATKLLVKKYVLDGQCIQVGIHINKTFSNNEQFSIMQYANGAPPIWVGTYFIPDEGNQYSFQGDSTTRTIKFYYKAAGLKPGNVAWRYLEEVNGVKTWKDPGSDTVGTYSVTKNTLTLDYNPNRKIIGIWAKYVSEHSSNSTANGKIWNYAEGDGVAANPPADSSYTAGEHFINYSDTLGGSAFTYAQEPGKYTLQFNHACGQFSSSENYLRNSAFSIVIKPIDVTVTMNTGATLTYGDKLELGALPSTAGSADLAKKVATANNGVDVGDLGLIFAKSYGTDAGSKNVIAPIGWTNKKYNVTFTGNATFAEV